MRDYIKNRVGLGLLGVGVIFLTALIALVIYRLGSPTSQAFSWEVLSVTGGFCMVAMLFGSILAFDWQLHGFHFAGVGFKIGSSPGAEGTSSTSIITRVDLPEEELREKEEYARTRKVALPGSNAPTFSLETDLLDLSNAPKASPLVPMYILDDGFRVLDWNEAFSLAFDNTLEGRRGVSILEWTYFLTNYRDVLDHGIEVFAQDKPLPEVDVEDVRYHNKRYDCSLVGKKRAYRVPGGDGRHTWLVTIQIDFGEKSVADRYYLDLSRHLRDWLMWTEYALSYDDVLTNTHVYPELLDTIVGGAEELEPVRQGACVLDLGCGTGNLAMRLAADGLNCQITAIDNNDFMLAALRRKCNQELKTPENQAGRIVAFKQNISSLFGLRDGHYDYVFANNVFYSMHHEDLTTVLEEIHSKLKLGGELRATGPRKNASVPKLFRRIRKELVDEGVFASLKGKFDHVNYVNRELLRPLLSSLSETRYCRMLEAAGFTVVKKQFVYGDQAWYIVGRKDVEIDREEITVSAHEGVQETRAAAA